MRAETIINSDHTVSESMALTEDMTVNGVLTVQSGATIDVAGHMLTIKGIGTGTGTVTSSAAGGVLNFNIPDGGTCVNSALTISGGSNMTVWKTGGGFLQMTKLNKGFGGNGVVSMIVKAGTVKKGADTGGDNPNGANAAFCGAEYSTIEVKNGGQFDIGGRTCWNYDYIIEGDGPEGATVKGALINTVRPGSLPWDWTGGRGYLRNITLSGDATIGTSMSSNNPGYAAHLPLHYENGGECDTVLDGHVLKIAGPGFVYIGDQRKFDAGEIYVEAGSVLNTYGATSTGHSEINTNMCDITLKIDGTFRTESRGFSPLKSLIFGATGELRAENAVNQNKQMTVRETYAPNLSATNLSTIKNPKVQLGESGYTATTLDLSLFTNRTFDVGTLLTFYSGSTVTVKTGLRDDIAPGTKLVSWTAATKPDVASFTLQCDGTSAEDRHLEAVARNDGLYLKSTLTPFYAIRNVQEGKWEFYLENGTTFPEEWSEITGDMEVRFSSYAEYQAIKALGVSPSRFLLTSLPLPAGAEPAFYDMGSGMDFDVASGLTIDVCGNRLRLPPAVVGGDTAFTVTSSAAGGVFDIWVDKGGTVQNKNVTISGGTNMTVWKTGEGFLQMLKENTGFGGKDGVVSMVVKAGTVKKGEDNEADGSNVAYCGAQYSTIVVEDGGQFDIGGRTYWDYDYIIEGDGPKGAAVKGALINTLQASSTPWTSGSNTGYLRDITLSGDATIGGNVLWALHFWNGSECNTVLDNHVLTIAGTRNIYIGNNRKFDSGEIYAAPGSILNANGGVNRNMRGITLKIDGTYRTETNAFSPLKSLIFGASGILYAESDNNQQMVVLDTYAPNLSVQSGSKITHPKVQLGEKDYTTPTLDLTLFENKTFASGGLTTFYSGAAVSVKLDGRTDLKTIAKSASPYLMTWSSSAKPAASVSFETTGDAKAKGFKLKAEDAGLRLLPPAGFIVIVR